MSRIPSREEEKAALQALLAAGTVQPGTNLSHLLEYVTSRYFEGKAAEIKEYSIAVDALGRPADFNPKANALVRVEAHRLRKRLRDYYQHEGAPQPVHIGLPEGSYVPRFFYREEQEELAPAPVLTETVAEPAPVVPKSRGFRLPPRYAVLVALLVLLAAGVIVALTRSTHASTKPQPSRLPHPALVSEVRTGLANPAETPEVRILAGRGAGRYRDRFSHVWDGDRFFHGGWTAAVRPGVVVKGYDPNLFTSMREGDFSYDIPLRPGTYELHLLFAETEYGEENPLGGGQGSRIMNIAVNGAPTLTGLDVFDDAGGANTADMKVIADVSPASDGVLHIGVSAAGLGAGLLNGIEVVPALPGYPNALRMVAQTTPFHDRQGALWEPDHFVTGGTLIQRPGPPGSVTVGNAEIYTGERYGSFTYALPVAPGTYDLSLYFAETWFGPQMPGGGGAGSRIFDVYCGHRPLLENFDVFRAAGSPSRTIRETFHGLTPDRRGKLVLSFEPRVNWAFVNAIEVVPHAGSLSASLQHANLKQ